jgi:hypothetical protein
LYFAANQTMATIAVPIIGNNIFQADKTFTVSLSYPLASKRRVRATKPSARATSTAWG